MNRTLLTLASLWVVNSALASPPHTTTKESPSQPPTVMGNKKVARAADRAGGRKQPCQAPTPERKVGPQGTLLWGTKRQVAEDEMSSVLTSLEAGRVRWGGGAVGGVRVEEGHLVASPRADRGLVGALLQGTASDGQSIEVALCGAEPSPDDPALVWYRLEIWSAEHENWENPCFATQNGPAPLALAVAGVWDKSGTRHERAGKFTFACENGAIAKCITWGYKPWAKKHGHSLKELHQACTRMARADYCGNGRSYTREATLIDMYDGLGVLTRTPEESVGSNSRQWLFEAAWDSEGAVCLARTRDGRKAETILNECPERFQVVGRDLDEKERCTVSRREGGTDASLLRNQSYSRGE